MRRGVFGGSFDPVHVGHIELARLCADRAGLDVVDFVPAARQPLKRHGPRAANHHRLEMLKLALAGLPRFEPCDMELTRGGVSYTVDTLRELHDRHAGEELFFLMGADALRDLPNWREPAEILRLARPLVVARQGEPLPDWGHLAGLVDEQRLEEFRHGLITDVVAPVSSSEVRRRLAAGETVDGMLAPTVTDYIRAHGLYQQVLQQ